MDELQTLKWLQVKRQHLRTERFLFLLDLFITLSMLGCICFPKYHKVFGYSLQILIFLPLQGVSATRLCLQNNKNI